MGNNLRGQKKRQRTLLWAWKKSSLILLKFLTIFTLMKMASISRPNESQRRKFDKRGKF